VLKAIVLDQVLTLSSLSYKTSKSSLTPALMALICLNLDLALTDTRSSENKDDGDVVLVESGSGASRDGVLEVIDNGHSDLD
jgi:hypothetical protein